MQLPCALTLVIAALLAGATSSVCAQTIAGRATVVDGEMLDVRGTQVRLFGVDAPQGDQVCEGTDDNRWRCGQRAAMALEDILDESIVSCIEMKRDGYGRIVAVCSLAGIDIGLWLVRNGLAHEWAAYSNGRYHQVAEEAKAQRRGIWSGSDRDAGPYRSCLRSGRSALACLRGP